jgi:pilus assembly protein CpaF
MSLAARFDTLAGVPPTRPAPTAPGHADDGIVITDDPVVVVGDDDQADGGSDPGSADRSLLNTTLDRVRRTVQRASGDGVLSPAQFRRTVEAETDRVLTETAGLDRAAIISLRSAVLDELLGYGPIQDLLDRSDVSEIMVNGPNCIFVERSGRLERTDRQFDNEEHLMSVIDRMVRSSGRRVDQSSPMVDARLPDGSRLNVVVPPLAVDGAALTVRKFTARHLTSADLVSRGALSAEAADLLHRAVSERLNVIVSGGTGTGKTTMLNMLSSHIGRTERVVTVEDAVELQLDMPNLVRLEARPANTEGAGQVTIRDLVRNSLRMRPDRIVVGEVRGAEALDMLQAMNTGHDGSLSTLHANTPRDALRRLETMVLFGGIDLPLRAIREQVCSAIDLIVQLTRDHAGRRFVSSITEVAGMEGDVVSTADIFVRGGDGLDGSFPLVATGIICSRLRNDHGHGGGQ